MAEQPKARRRNTREELIKAGVEEINRYGVAGFSMRRIAQLCGQGAGRRGEGFAVLWKKCVDRGRGGYYNRTRKPAGPPGQITGELS